MNAIELIDATHVVVVPDSSVNAADNMEPGAYRVGLVMDGDFTRPYLLPGHMVNGYGLAKAVAYAETLTLELNGDDEFVPVAKVNGNAIVYVVDEPAAS